MVGKKLSHVGVILGFVVMAGCSESPRQALSGRSTNMSASDAGSDAGQVTNPDASAMRPDAGPPPKNVTFEVQVKGQTREYRLYVPDSTTNAPMPLLIAINGGDGNFYPFPQESQFHQLAEEEGFIMAHPISQLQPGNEGEWLLNTGATGTRDIDFMERLIEDIDTRYGVDQKRVYATGYSLGSMFMYELACHLSTRFAAVASHSGSMPVSPASCEPSESLGLMHLHGVDDYIIAYGNTWAWKDWPAVGTMRDVPSLVEYWKNKYNCGDESQTDMGNISHIVHDMCDSNVRVEHHRINNAGHEWPDRINQTSTHRVIWSFVSGFSKP